MRLPRSFQRERSGVKAQGIDGEGGWGLLCLLLLPCYNVGTYGLGPPGGPVSACALPGGTWLLVNKERGDHSAGSASAAT